MKANLNYLWYVLKHKYFVFVAGRKLGLGFKQLLLHDMSKFSRAEWKPYVDKFQRNDSSQFKQAVQHHYDSNPHHWQYWDKLTTSYTKYYPTLEITIGQNPYIQMPETYVREMVADWMGAARVQTGSWNIVEWYARNRDKMKLHPNTRKLVEAIIPQYNPFWHDFYTKENGCQPSLKN